MLGATYLRIHYSADPAKDVEWARGERAQSPPKEWAREMEMDENVYAGEAVFPEYRDTWHNCTGDGPIQPISTSVFLGGWDVGTTIHPAFVLVEVTQELQVRAILEVIPPAPEPMSKFAPRVQAALIKRLPGRWDEVRHYGDATLATRSGTTGDTAQMVAKREAGIHIKPISNEWGPRYGAVIALLMRNLDERTPGFLVDGANCPVLRDGFRGAYRFEESSQGEGTGAGRILKSPLKDSYSHIQDGLQYVAVPLVKDLTTAKPTKKRLVHG